MDLDAYDRALARVYDAGGGVMPLAAPFEAACGLLGADATGVSVYDEADRVITHTFAWPPRAPGEAGAAQVRALNDDAGARLVLEARLAAPRRFSDIVPAHRLRHARWFREQTAMTGLANGMAADIVAAGIRLRLFALRRAGRAEFSKTELDLLGRIAAHFGRAFARDLQRLSPHTAAGIGLIVYHADRVAPAFHAGSEAIDAIVRRCGLSPAEARVLAAMAVGRSRRAGADALGIGVNSLKSHMRRIYAKTGARRLPELMLLLRDPGQIMKPPSTGKATP